MRELAQRFIGKECIIYTTLGTFIGSPIEGTIEEVTDNGMIVRGKDGIEAVNLDHVTRVREWPRKKNGKKKLVLE